MLVVGVLAGCSDGGDGNGGTDGDGADGGDSTPTQTPSPTPTPTARSETVLVGPEAENAFDPDTLEIPIGTQVTFVWESSGHSLLIESQPDASDWEGVPETQDEGFEHSHTFEASGTYDYYCEPHQAFGMEATITVTE